MDSPAASSFKGIALFTPGGDCVYCLDEQKRAHWHLDLCATLQTHLGLIEPPYFLLPCFTATVDRWVSPGNPKPTTMAEAYPRALRFQPLLNVLFGLGDWRWLPNYGSVEECSVAMIESYRPRFPQLWESHDLIIQLDRIEDNSSSAMGNPAPTAMPFEALTQLYQFKLFVRGVDTAVTEKMLRLLYSTLEQSLPNAYTLQVIDVTTHPDEAEAANISATPTLIQLSPEPVRRVVGHALDQEHIVQLLSPP